MDEIEKNVKKKAGRPPGSKNKRVLHRKKTIPKSSKHEKSKTRKSPIINPTTNLETNLSNTTLCASAIIQQISKKTQSAKLKEYEMRNYSHVVKNCQEIFIGFARFLAEMKEKKLPSNFIELEMSLSAEKMQNKSTKELIEATKKGLCILEQLENEQAPEIKKTKIT
jgi:hypothetical protein